MDATAAIVRVAPPLRTRVWLVYLGLGLGCLALYLALPMTLRDSAYDLFDIAALAAVLAGVARFRPERTRQWLVVAAGIALIACGDIAATVAGDVASIPLVWLPPALYVAGPCLIAIGLAGHARPKSRGLTNPALIDGALIAVALGTIASDIVAGPLLRTTADPISLALACAQPFLDLVLILLLARLVLGGRPRPALLLLALAFLSWFVSDVWFASASIGNGYVRGTIFDAGWLGGFILLGAAALHPSMADLSTEGDPSIVSRLRILVLSTSLAVPVLGLALQPVSGPIDVVFAVAGSSIVVVLMISRLLGSLRRTQALLAEEAILRRQLADAYAETGRWSEQLERIEALSHHLNRSRAVLAVADAVASQIDSVIDWHGLRFYLLAPDGKTLDAIKLACKVDHYAHHTPDLLRLRLGEGLGGHIAASGTAEIINDATHDPRTRQIPGTESIDESMIVVPLRYENAVLGVIELFRLGRDAFDTTDLRLAQIIGAQASVAIYNARQLEELERRSAALERRLASQRQLLVITEKLLVHRESGSIFEAIADTLAEVVPHDTLTIYRVDRAAGCLVPTLARDQYADEILASRPALGAGITGDVIAKGEAEVVNDALHDPRMILVPGTPVEQSEAMIVAPIRTSDGVIGALNLYRAGRQFDADDLELVRLFANHAAIAVENASIHDQLIEAAVTDPLTSLPNRRLFIDRVDHALLRRGDRRAAVLFLDLDGFKLVNDSLGHAAGDAVLVEVAGRLRRCARASDTVARLGGDEFAVLFEDVESEADVVAMAERINTALCAPLILPGRTVSVRASLGIAVSEGNSCRTSFDLLRSADTAMYQARATRRHLAVFEPAMHARQLKRLELEGELRGALAAGQFRLVYQPIVALGSGQILGAEALLRWDRPGGEIGPAEFIPMAEETGDIVPLGRWVIGEACRQARGWQLMRPELRRFGLSVNTSGRELSEAGFIAEVEAILAETGLAARDLTLEITESVMLADETAAIATLRRLRSLGVHIAVDDFGTGYSSLSYLNRLPVDELKIDRSFVQQLGPSRSRSALVGATLEFARALRLSVTAEGVETEYQMRRLHELGCSRAQGYWLSRPLPPAELADRLAVSTRFDVAAVSTRRPAA